LNPLVTNRRDDLEIRGEHAKGDVEAYLIVAGPGGAVRYSAGADLPGCLHQRESLLGSLGGDAQRVNFPPKDVALNQEAHEPVVNLRARIDLVMLDGTDGLCLLPNCFALLSRGATGVYVDGVHRPAPFGQAGHTVGRIEPARKGERQWSTRRMHTA
jgi:hypothetical protein